MDGPLFFADANRFRERLNELIKSNPEPVRALVVDATAISQTDTDGADIVIQVAQELRSQGISLAVAHLEHSIGELWTRAGVIDAIGPDRVFEAVHALNGPEPRHPRRPHPHGDLIPMR
jgi:SulP family sulfate permease